MTDTPISATEAASLAACGFKVDGSAARIAGAMTVEALPHGACHYKLVVTLPGGAQVFGFVPCWKIAAAPRE